MKTFPISNYGFNYDCFITLSSYNNNNNMAIILDTETDGQYGVASVNFDKLDRGYAYLNTNNLPGIDKVFEDLGFAEFTGIKCKSGWVEYPLYKFDFDKMKEYVSPVSDYFFE